MHVLSVKNGKYVYYQCASRKPRHAPVPCGNANHPVKLVDAAVWHVIVTYHRAPTRLRKAVAESEVTVTCSWESQITSAEKRLSMFARKEVEIIRHRADDLLSEEGARLRLTEMKRDREHREADHRGRP